ncbi:MAG: trimeric intracellular cation channel family protein [Verrucomicrobiota bacterium]
MKLQFLLEHFAVAVAAITGVLAARGKQVDMFGVLVLALVTAFGGGTVRDLMLGDVPVTWIRHASYLLNAATTALVTFFLAQIFESRRNLLVLADAFSLALFTIVGAEKALNFQVSPASAIALGVITGVVGGMLRDVLTGEIPLVFRPQIYLYATASLAGAAVFVGLVTLFPLNPSNALIGISIVLVLRLVAIRWKVGLPVFGTDENANPS